MEHASAHLDAIGRGGKDPGDAGKKKKTKWGTEREGKTWLAESLLLRELARPGDAVE